MNSSRKKESALGRGLDALIRKDVLKDENIEKTETKKEISEASKSNEIRENSEQIIEEVMLEVKKNPRISLWSAKSAAALRFLKKTRPEFSISKEASALIEQAVQEKYPEIWILFEGKGL